MTEQRKLAAIMFTDIIGYTRLMSQDEHKALQILQKNRDIQKPLVKKHSGEFLKEMGDGTLLCFQSTLDAVRCALEIQHSIMDDPDLNLRIGIHLGDIVFKEGDVFGDGVNVASRIERLAEGGGICISEQVYETIRNKPGMNANFLGEKMLKNVRHPVKVYAMQEDGLVSPKKPISKSPGFARLKKRKYAVLIGSVIISVLLTLLTIFIINQKDSLNLNENLIAVAAFENQTGDESLDPVGRMTSDWITQGIASTGLISMVPSFKLKAIDEIHQNMDGIRSLAEETTAQTIITGVFYREGDQLQFHAHIVNALNGEILNVIGPVSGEVDDPLLTIERLRQKIMGALAANFDENFNNYSDRTLNPPSYEAYSEFLLGVDLFFNYQYEKASIHFYKAAELDTTYYTPYLWACGSHWNNATYTLAEDVPESIKEYRKFDSLTHFLEIYRNKLTQGEQYHLDWVIGFREGDTEGIYKAALNAAPYYLIFEYEKALDALNANYPQIAIEVLSRLEPELHFPGWYFGVLADAYHMVGDHRNELKTAQNGRKNYPESWGLFYDELKAFAALGKFEEINQRLNESLNFPKSDYWTTGELMTYTARDLRAHGYAEEAKEVIIRSIDWYNFNSADKYGEELAVAYYVAEQWDRSQELFELLANGAPERIEYWGYLGAIAARKGEKEESARINKLIADLDRPYLFGKDLYWRARIAALSGDKDMAVLLLRDAILRGLYNSYYDFHDILICEEMDFESLRSYPPFQELIKPK